MAARGVESYSWGIKTVMTLPVNAMVRISQSLYYICTIINDDTLHVYMKIRQTPVK